MACCLSAIVLTNLLLVLLLLLLLLSQSGRWLWESPEHLAHPHDHSLTARQTVPGYWHCLK